jgi:hypothetical protein
MEKEQLVWVQGHGILLRNYGASPQAKGGRSMKRNLLLSLLIVALVVAGGCSTAYQAKPLPFKAPSAYANVQDVGGVAMAAEAFVDSTKAQDAFGFDVRGAGFLPVQLVFDNHGAHPL